MLNQSLAKRLVAIFFVASVIVGCETVQRRPTTQLVSEVTGTATVRSDETLSVFPVKGGKHTERSAWVVTSPTVDNEQFRGLLLGSLNKAGLFKEVSAELDAPYALHAEIIFQDITSPGMTNTLMLLVHYKLIEQTTGDVLWKENIYTQSDLSVSEIFVGEVRTERLLEQGLVENMNTLIGHLGKYLDSFHAH